MYEFDAGDLCLDFANTNDWHASDHPLERMTNFSDLVTWGEQAGVISPEKVIRLKSLENDQPEQAARAYDFAIQVREAIYRIFAHRNAGKPIPESDLSILNAVVREALAHRQLSASGDEFRWEWTSGINDTKHILWSVAYSAAQLLTSDDVSRVRVCEDDRGCGYLFIDRTKNHSRRWCSMESCGNRAKARRHYSRVQAG